MCVKLEVSCAVAKWHTNVTRHVAAAWRVRRVYRQGFESPVRTATDIFGVRTVSPIIRSEMEIRGPSVSASDNVGHAANSSFQADRTNAVIAAVTCATRTERLATYVICSH